MEKALRPGEIFGRRVREARIALGWTQQHLADRLTEIGRNTDRAHVARTEKGQTLAPLEMVIALGAALHVPPVHLLVPLDDNEAVAVTSKLKVDAPTARAWIRGRGLLPGEDVLDIWPHLPESEKRRIVTQPSDPRNALWLALTSWYEPDEVDKRVAGIDTLAEDHKQKEDRDA